MTRTTTLLLGAALAATSLLAACGDDAKPATTPTTQAGTGTTGMSQDAFCDMVRNYEAKSNEFDALFQAGTPTPEALETAFTTMAGLQGELVANAPADVKADAELVLAGVDEMVAMFAAHNWDVAALMTSDDAAEFQALIDDPAIADAGDRLDQWGFDTCGIPLDS
ncbi:MAG: hypothetical protein Q7V88_12975 [Actinomycetota bacterium]|nr:hypothetical protein [Actinomycetota bacterium]